MSTYKDQLRKSLKPISNKEEKDQRIIQYLKFFLEGKKVALYMALANEVDLSKLLKEDIYLPKTDDRISFYKNTGNFTKGKFGVLEPLSEEKIDTNDLDVIVIPALAYNKKGYRLGRGKGYYDKALENFSGLKIGVIYDDLLIDDDFQEAHDLKVDILITEKRVIKFEV
ncbi:MAG TPA: 5-formyltetrahydrofolate cyclo-ligase [Acholeplasma sp.]|nr:5-formyltetrahydrofolate cyclo-ligase [Acholeplasma sp.]